MIRHYVLKNFRRRKIRTALMVLALLVSTGLIVTMSATVATVRQSNVDLVASATGRYDLGVSKIDTSPDPYLDVAEIAPQVLAAHPAIRSVHARIQATVEFSAASGGGATGDSGRGTLLALEQASDDIGYIDVLEGEYTLGERRAAVLEETALNFNLAPGDTVEIAYSFPLPREVGQAAAAGASERRSSERFTIAAIVRQDGVAAGLRSGFIIDLADAQAWLDQPGRAQALLATVDPALYETNNAEQAALNVRAVAQAVQQQLGPEYSFSLEKASVLDSAAQGFLAIQALINTYGLIALGIVGLLVHTLVMTNVQEQRRDMAILRILGGQRNLLFAIVIVEVLVIGAIGVLLGIGLGQLITTFIVVPLIEAQMQQVGINPSLTPRLTLSAILPAVIAALVVLVASSLKPAQDAARTKVMHAINPGVADNIQIEDLAALRERRPSGRLFLAGLVLMLIFGLIAGFQVVQSFGGPALEVTFVLLALGLLVLGLGLLFFITTVPFERLVLLVMGLLMPRLTYFARRNVGRGQLRNTLISLLVLFSGVLPSFLATQTALENANLETSTRLSLGAPLNVRVFTPWGENDPDSGRLRPSFISDDLQTIAGIDQVAALTYGYSSQATDPVGLRSARVTIAGVEGPLGEVLFADMVEFAAGDAGAFAELLEDPTAVIISEGLAEHLVVEQGGTIKLEGEGLDNTMDARVAAIARRVPGVGDVSRSRLDARSGSTILISLDGFRQLITPLGDPLPPPDEPVFEALMATLAPGAASHEVAATMGERYGMTRAFWSRFLDVELENARRNQATQRVFLLVLTGISFTTAVFGVFAVIYVTIYARRLEIGMMKAVGMLRRELTGMLIVEAIAMTLGAALAGIAAGASMGYIAFYGQKALAQEPARFAVDTTVVPFIVVMVVLASILGAAFSARRIVKRQAIEILRME